MSRTLTIRLPGPAFRRIEQRARSLGVTPSELVRRLIGEVGDGAEPTAWELTQRWVGHVSDGALTRGRDAREALEGWDPDRRG